LGWAGISHAVTIDFQDASSVTHSGAVAMDSATATVHGVTYELSGDFGLTEANPSYLLSNSGGFTYADLYNDFAFSNGGSFQLSLSGLTANSDYSVRFFASEYYPAGAPWPGAVTNLFGATTGTGTTLSIPWSRSIAPTSNFMNSAEGVFTTSASGSLVFGVSGFKGPGAGSGPVLVRLNGLQLNAVPEPASGMLLLFGVGLLGAASRRC